MTSSGLVRQLPLVFLVAVFLILLAPQAHSQIAITPSTVSFGTVLLGSNQTQTVSITNNGSSSLTVSQVSVSGTGYTVSGLTYPLTLSPGQSAGLNVTFAPPAVGADSGSVSVSVSTQTSKRPRKSRTGTTASTVTVPLTGSGMSAGQIAASPAALNFGSISPGTSQMLSETLTNTGGAAVTISQASMSSAVFAISGVALPASLAAGQSLTFSVAFSPTVSGSASGTLAIFSTASNSQLNIALSGTGATLGQLMLTPSALNFGNVTTGSSAALTGTLTATGSAVTVSSATNANSEFVLSGISFPATVAAGQSVPFTVTFLPQASGSTADSLSFLSNATNSLVAESLTGSGVAPVQHSVNLSWTTSTSSTVVGYNVYRTGVSGGPYVQVTSLDASPNFMDSAVSSGQTYYYVVTAVDGAGTESVYSNEAQAVVPTP